MKALIAAGAEKITVNTAAVENPQIIAEAASQLGSQCVVVSIDAKRHADGRYEVYTQNGTRQTGMDPISWAQESERLGAGEILLNARSEERRAGKECVSTFSLMWSPYH